MIEQPSIARAIGLSFLGLIIFNLTNAILAGVFTAIVYLIAKVSFLYIVANWLARFLRPDSFFIPIFGYSAALLALRKLSKQKETADLACVLLGAYLLIISMICLVINLLYENKIWLNIVYGIAGIVFIVRKSADMVD